MKVNELRIGNYYKGGLEIVGSREAKLKFMDSERTVKLILEHFQVFSNAPMIVEMMNPIPLTEKWLTDFGFIASENNRLFYKGEVFKFTMNAYNSWFCVYRYELNDMGNISKGYRSYFETNNYNEIKYSDQRPFTDYVHQLQNLYFALTGEELNTTTASIN